MQTGDAPQALHGFPLTGGAYDSEVGFFLCSAGGANKYAHWPLRFVSQHWPVIKFVLVWEFGHFFVELCTCFTNPSSLHCHTFIRGCSAKNRPLIICLEGKSQALMDHWAAAANADCFVNSCSAPHSWGVAVKDFKR